MSTFWRPVPGNVMRPRDAYLQRHGGLSEMWARCDLCQWSGPICDFILAGKNGQTRELCFTCGEDADVIKHLINDGWKFR